jgi:hypothetical protein
MKRYYYFLYRIYWFYKDKQNETEGQALFSATAVSTVILSFLIFSFYGIANYLGLKPFFTEKSTTIIFVIFVGFVNYFFFIRGKKFLNFNFEKDVRGGFLIVLFLFFVATFFLIVANLNRTRIFKEGKGVISNEPRRESLEGTIRKWLE